jgi:hypothetical protein
MAVTPAAKNPDTFASSNLTGGNSATGAVMGLPQNQALGSAGQPPAQASMPQLPTGPAGFDNYFNSPQQAVSGPPNNDAVIQQMYAQQAGQAQANTQALMAPAAPQLQYAVSADDKNVLIGGKTYDIDSNPTAVWNAVNSPEGQQSATEAPPGYKLVPAKMVANYLQSVDHGMFSNAYQGAKELVTRAPGALLNTAGDAAKWAGADTVGQGLNSAGAAVDQFTGADQVPDTLGRGTVGSWFVQSMADAAPMLPIMAASLALPETALPRAFQILGDAGLNLGLFGGQAAQQKKESLIQQGVAPDQANKAGWADFFTQGGGLMAMGQLGKVASSGTYGAAQQVVAKLQQAVGKGAMTAEQAAAAVTNPAYFARMLTNGAGNIGVQGATMAGMGAASAASNNAYGGEHQDVGDAALHGLGSGLSFGAILSPLAAFHSIGDSGRRAALQSALADAKTPVDLLQLDRGVTAAKQVQPEVAALAGEQPAQQWRNDLQSTGNQTLMDNNARAWQAKQAAAAKAAEDAKTKPAVPPVDPSAPPPSGPPPTPPGAGPVNPIAPPPSGPPPTPPGAGPVNPIAPAGPTAEQERAELAQEDALNAVGIPKKNKVARAKALDAMAQGVNLESPEAETLVKALKSGKLALADAEIARLKGLQNDGTSGLPPTGTAEVGKPASVEPAGSVGAGVVDAGQPVGGVRDSTGTSAPGVQPTVAGGDARVGASAVETKPIPGLPTGKVQKAPKSVVPDFSEPPTTSGGEPPVKTGQVESAPVVARKKVVNPEKPAVAHVAEGEAPVVDKSLTVEQAFNRLKTGLPKYSELSPEMRATIDDAHTRGELTQDAWDASAKAAKETQAKQNRKRVELESDAEDSKTPEQRAADAAELTTIPPADVFHKVFGKIFGERVWQIANGKTFGEVGAAEAKPVSEDGVRKSVKRLTMERIDAAMKKGDITPEQAIAVKEALDIAQEKTVKRKTQAAVQQDGGDSSALTTDMSPEQAKDLIVNGNVRIQGADNMGVKSKAEKQGEAEQKKAIEAETPAKDAAPVEETRGKKLATNEEILVQKTKDLEEQLQAALAAKDYPKAAEIREKQKEFELLYKKGLKKQAESESTTLEKTGDKSIDDRIDEINDKIADAEDNGDHKLVTKLEDERQKLYDKRDEEIGGETVLKTEEGGARTEDGRWKDESDDSTASYGKTIGEGVEDPYKSAEDLHDELAKWMGVEKLPPHMKVVDTAADLKGDDAHYAMEDGSPFGWTKGGKVVLIADRIKRGEGKGAFIHEVGSHLGLDRILGADNIDRIHKAIKQWAARDDGSTEAAIAKAAMDRVTGAKTDPHQVASETVAYFVQEAVNRGIEPTALKAYDGRFGAIIRQIYAAFKSTMRRVMRGADVTKMTAEDMVNMAYGAARLETGGSWHGTAASFHSVKFGKNVNASIDKLPGALQEPVRNTTEGLSRWATSAIDKVIFTRDLVKRGVARGLDALETFDQHRESRDALAGHYQKAALNAIEDVRLFSTPEKRALSEFLQESTLSNAWGYGPKRAENSRAAKLYDDLSPRAQRVAQAVFEHGDTILKAKKDAITSLADEMYKPMIAEATAAGDHSAARDLTLERNALLDKYNKLLSIGEGQPYVSMQRRGDFVAVGKSDAYLKAEAAAKTEGAGKAERDALEKMQTDPDHYLVSEAQSEQEAKALRDNMRAAGFPSSGEHTYYKPKNRWTQEGGGVLAGMAKLRNKLDMMAQDSTNPADRAQAASMRNLLTHMWLDALSHRSSRKAEMRRVGVHGTMDVVDSFRQSAASDAHFISGVKYNDKMLTALKDAREQADRGEGEERTTNLNLLHEFLLRHEQSTNAVPTPWANKITKATALWQIATSPAHYIGNLMQPWTMTLPYLQAQHGYAKGMSEFFKAYKEIGAILGNTGLLRSLRLEDMPADVRAPMQRLLELGRLDIGMNTEYGSMSLHPKSFVTRAAQAATDRIAAASLKMEALNRLASAASAYRLEFARTGDAEKALHYAADVVAETHGDHSRANAPRVFNNGFGKVALQFRKFQLVQLTQMAKMIGALNTANPEERMVAIKHLAYTMAHVAALGGAVGMPGFSTFSSISQNLTNLLTGVEGEDWETKLEKAVGDKNVAQLLLRGIPGALGVDLTSKVGYGDMLGIAPYTDVNFADRNSVQDAIGQVTAGPFGGLVGRAAQSLHHMIVGNYYKGVEGLMPQGIANVMRGAREGTQGVTNTKNDKLMNLNAGEAFIEALGFQPSSKSLMQSETGAMIKSTEEFKSRLETLKERYTNTVKDRGDPSSDIKNLNALRQEMMERGFKPTPLGDMLRSPTQQLIRQIFTTPSGVQYKPSETGRAVAQLPT